MQNFFQKLFDRSSETNQVQREALVDLCLLGMYSDTLVSLAEQDFLDAQSARLPWESGMSFDLYLQTTIPKVRALKNDPLKIKELIQDIDRRLGSDEFKRNAIDELENLLSTDGIIKIEGEFLTQVKAVIGI
ncbi:hypothetical protein [Chamaesiphon minutus]|uniref:Tellurite resistance protein TerB n=1 Tax=Chamaesiphon minutus (strain ATCC 27169 / PCC 6605) TaxID=1173020 RepID=K9UFM1_CHAP6|nr:hypothetical protein [Chamaesiphon minutus]AFY93448.1 hypothetical protein Cha6605_2387 [Chamaesiphon minutus PCC 6605]